jgi:hypothetical protein
MVGGISIIRSMIIAVSFEVLNMKFERMCVICGKALKITVKDDKSYSGGHFFNFDGIKKNGEGEYWECNMCYHNLRIFTRLKNWYKYWRRKNGSKM